MNGELLGLQMSKTIARGAEVASAYTLLLELLRVLDADRIAYRLSRPRDEAVMVEAAVPGERWEIEVFEDGHVEFERFLSTGHVGNFTELEQCLALHR